MRKEVYALGFCIIIIVGFLSGCQESETGAIIFEGVSIDSSIVELSNASFDIISNSQDEVIQVEVYYQLHNIAGRDLYNVKIFCDFYDDNDNLINRQGPKTIGKMPIDYVETESPGFNHFTYEGDDVGLVKRAVLSVFEEE